jgi:hypothetical protein
MCFTTKAERDGRAAQAGQRRAAGGAPGDTRCYSNVLSAARARGRLHDVEPQEGLEMMPPVTLSRLVASKAMRTVPYPARPPLPTQGSQ